MYQNSEALKSAFNYCDIPVNFAGLIGTTRDMVRQGWQLNLNSSRFEHRHSLALYFTGVNRSLNLKIISAVFELDYFSISKLSLGTVFSYMSNCPVRISGCNEHIVVSMVGENRVMKNSWNGTFGFVDPIQMKNHDFDSLFHFPSIESQIFVREDKIWTIEEHLKAIRDAQEPMQNEILKGGNLNIKTQTKLQLVGIA